MLINYRRADTAGHAGRLYDTLSARFGEDSVFMDVAGIDIGEDFVAAIEREVATSDVVVVLIGREWSTAADAAGRRRLEDPEDYVSLEIATALDRDVRVIPVLVEGARMPTAAELPPRLIGLARRNALELSDARWRYDAGRLIEAIEAPRGRTAETPVPAPPPPSPAPSRPWWRSPLAAGGAVALVAAVVLVVVLLATRGGGGSDNEPMVVSPGTVSFGTYGIDQTSRAAPVLVANTGDTPVTVQSFRVEPDTDFIRDEGTCLGAVLDPGTACTAAVRFRPSAEGTREARLVVKRIGSGVARSVDLEGTGAAAPAPGPEPPTTTSGTAAATTVEATQTAPTDTGATAPLPTDTAP